jgi:hypothetical protein
MAAKPASVFFGFAVAAAVAAASWLFWKRTGAEPGPPVGPPKTGTAGGGATPGGTPKKGTTPGKPRPKRPPPAPIPPVEATRDGCLAFLRQQASPTPPAPGGKGVPVWSDLRTEAMDALVLADPGAAEPVVLQALGGDGDPSDWGDERLHAAALRIRAGKPDGAETVKAYLKSGEDPADTALETSRAATWLPPAEGAAVVRRLLAAKIDEYAEEDLAAILQAVAVLGDGAGRDELRKLAAPGADDGLEYLVRGAAAGALLRLGDASGRGVLAGLDDFDAADVARGLGARGNDAAVPVIEELLRSEDVDVRLSAARALGDVGGPKALEVLRRALKDPEGDVRAWAAVGLALHGGSDGIAEIRRAAGERDVELAIAAWKALATLGDAESKAAAAKILAGEAPQAANLDRHSGIMLRIWAAALVLRTGK